MKLIPLVILAAALLSGCKPPKFNQDITCPSFHAAGVTIYEYSNPEMLVVLYPDYSVVKVDKTECVVRQEP